MSILVKIRSIELDVEDGHAVVEEQKKDKGSDKKEKGNKGSKGGDDEKRETELFRKDGCCAAAEVSWEGDQRWLSGEWMGVSKPWRNVHEKSSLGFKSSRTWFQEKAQFTATTEEALNQFANCDGMKIAIYQGRKVFSESKLIGQVTVPLHLHIICGEQFNETIQIETTDSPVKLIRIHVSAYPDEELLGCLAGSHTLSLNHVQFNMVPNTLTDSIVKQAKEQSAAAVAKTKAKDKGKDKKEAQDSESSEDIQQGELLLSEADLDNIVQLVQNCKRELEVTVVLRTASTTSSKDLESEQKDSDEEGLSTVDNSNENDETASTGVGGEREDVPETAHPEEGSEIQGDESNIAPPPIDQAREFKFVLGGFYLHFDKDSQSWTAQQKEISHSAQKNQIFVVTRRSATILRQDLQECFGNAKVIIQYKDSSESSSNDDVVCIEDHLDLSAAVQPLHPSNQKETETQGQEGYIYSVKKYVAVSFQCNPKLVHAKPSMRLRTTCLPDQREELFALSRNEGGMVHDRNTFKRVQEQLEDLPHGKWTIHRHLKEMSMQMILQQLVESDPFVKTLALKSNDPLDVKTALCSHLLFSDGSRPDCQKARVQQLLGNAQEAEFTGDDRLADSLWKKLCILAPDQHWHGYAAFHIRSKRYVRALHLLDKVLGAKDSSLEKNELHVVHFLYQVARQLQEKSFQLEDHAAILSSLAKYELGETECVEFTSDLEGLDISKAAMARLLRMFAKQALDLKLDRTARQALIAANGLDEEPLVDQAFAASELLRARYKLQTGSKEAAVQILSSLGLDSENLSLESIQPLLRAEIQYTLGKALLGLDTEESSSRARQAFSNCLSLLNTVKVSASEDTAREVAKLRLDATFELAQLTLSKLDYRKARVIFRNATTLEPVAVGNLQWAWVGIGYVCVQLEDYATADEALRKALSLNPASPAAWASLFLLQTKLGNHKEATAALQFALDNGLRDTSRISEILTLLDAKSPMRSVVQHRLASLSTADE